MQRLAENIYDHIEQLRFCKGFKIIKLNGRLPVNVKDFVVNINDVFDVTTSKREGIRAIPYVC